MAQALYNEVSLALYLTQWPTSDHLNETFRSLSIVMVLPRLPASWQRTWQPSSGGHQSQSTTSAKRWRSRFGLVNFLTQLFYRFILYFSPWWCSLYCSPFYSTSRNTSGRHWSPEKLHSSLPAKSRESQHNSNCRRRDVLLTKTTFHWLTSILSSFKADNIVVSGIVITPLVVLKCPYLWSAAPSFDPHFSVDRKKAANPSMWVEICTYKFPLHCRSINCYVENLNGF